MNQAIPPKAKFIVRTLFFSFFALLIINSLNTFSLSSFCFGQTRVAYTETFLFDKQRQKAILAFSKKHGSASLKSFHRCLIRFLNDALILLSTSSFLALLFMMMILWRKLMGGVGD
jgi:hypothetical protein